MLTAIPTPIESGPLDDETRLAILDASEHAHRTLAEEGRPFADVHRITVCFRAAELMVDAMRNSGLHADHEVRNSVATGDHSYPTVTTSNGEVIVADPTWQQFLPKGNRTDHLPKVLIGTRDQVVAKARSAGVDEATLGLWKKGRKTTLEELQRANLEADQEADKAEERGGWGKFMAQSR
jgi:hypothetical protein